MAAFARDLRVSQAYIYQYLNGHKTPGIEMHERLRKLGADVEWIMTGNKAEEQQKERTRKAEVAIAFHAPGAMSEEQRKAIQKMIDELAALPPGQVDRAREIVKAAFKKK